MELIHCIYCSAATNPDLSIEDLEDILAVARKNNSENNLTGMLLYEDGAFFQVLEGDRNVVDSLYVKIEKDKRHERATKLIQEPIEERSFADWTMGYPKVSKQELNEIPGLNDFFTEGRSFFDLGEGRAKSLIEAFKKGRWHSQTN